MISPIYLIIWIWSDFDMVINLQFKECKNQINLSHCVDAKYFYTLTNFIIRKNHLLQDSKMYFQKKKEFYKAFVPQVYLLIYIYTILSLNLKTSYFLTKLMKC